MKLHHVGYVVRDLEAYAGGFPGLRLERAIYDPLQRARLSLYAVGGSYVELIQPEGPGAFTWAHLERIGDGLHHICYDGVTEGELEGVIDKHRMIKIRGPMPAVLFGRTVVFAMTRQKALVEFLL